MFLDPNVAERGKLLCLANCRKPKVEEEKLPFFSELEINFEMWKFLKKTLLPGDSDKWPLFRANNCPISFEWNDITKDIVICFSLTDWKLLKEKLTSTWQSKLMFVPDLSRTLHSKYNVMIGWLASDKRKQQTVKWALLLVTRWLYESQMIFWNDFWNKKSNFFSLLVKLHFILSLAKKNI